MDPGRRLIGEDQQGRQPDESDEQVAGDEQQPIAPRQTRAGDEREEGEADRGAP